MSEEPPAKVYPPNKRGEIKLRALAPSNIPLITKTALEFSPVPSRVPSAKDDRRTADERVRDAERRDAMSVALAQPHRGGSDDPRLAFPLGRFCRQAWPNDPAFDEAMHQAGLSYAKDVRTLKVARGFHVGGGESDAPRGGKSDDMTLEEIADHRAVIFGLERALERTDGLLIGVMPRCPNAMVRLCFDHGEPSLYDTDMLRQGLFRLAVHYGHWKGRS